MSKYVLSKEEISEFLRCAIPSLGIAEQTHQKLGCLESVVDSSRAWETKIICANYFVSMYLEKLFAQSGKHKTLSPEKVYQCLLPLAEEMYLCLDEFNVDFVDHVLKNCTRNQSVSFVENLRRIQEDAPSFLH